MMDHPLSAIESASKHRATVILLACGILSPVLYDGTDILRAIAYPGYSCRDQAVSELVSKRNARSRQQILSPGRPQSPTDE